MTTVIEVKLLNLGAYTHYNYVKANFREYRKKALEAPRPSISVFLSDIFGRSGKSKDITKDVYSYWGHHEEIKLLAARVIQTWMRIYLPSQRIRGRAKLEEVRNQQIILVQSSVQAWLRKRDFDKELEKRRTVNAAFDQFCCLLYKGIDLCMFSRKYGILQHRHFKLDADYKNLVYDTSKISNRKLNLRLIYKVSKGLSGYRYAITSKYPQKCFSLHLKGGRAIDFQVLHDEVNFDVNQLIAGFDRLILFMDSESPFYINEQGVPCRAGPSIIDFALERAGVLKSNENKHLSTLSTMRFTSMQSSYETDKDRDRKLFILKSQEFESGEYDDSRKSILRRFMGNKTSTEDYDDDYRPNIYNAARTPTAPKSFKGLKRLSTTLGYFSRILSRSISSPDSSDPGNAPTPFGKADQTNGSGKYYVYSIADEIRFRAALLALTQEYESWALEEKIAGQERLSRIEKLTGEEEEDASGYNKSFLPKGNPLKNRMNTSSKNVHRGSATSDADAASLPSRSSYRFNMQGNHNNNNNDNEEDEEDSDSAGHPLAQDSTGQRNDNYVFSAMVSDDGASDTSRSRKSADKTSLPDLRIQVLSNLEDDYDD